MVPTLAVGLDPPDADDVHERARISADLVVREVDLQRLSRSCANETRRQCGSRKCDCSYCHRSTPSLTTLGLDVTDFVDAVHRFIGVRTKSAARDGFLHPLHRD